MGAFRRASDMFQIWFVRCSGIIFGANEISMLTVDNFARDEHVSKTGKSACVRIGVWKVRHTLRTANHKNAVRGLGTDHIAQKTRALTGKVISQSKTERLLYDGNAFL